MIARVLLLLLLGWSSTVHGQPLPRFERAGDWALVCDNQQRCTITGVADAPGEVRIAMSLTREHRRAAPLLVRMVVLRHDGVVVEDAHLHGAGFDFALEGPGGGLVLRADGTVIDGLQFFDPAQSATIVGWFVRHRPAHLLSGGQPYARLPRGELGRLVRHMDRRQPDVALPEEPWPEFYEAPRFDYEIYPREQVAIDALPPEIVRECPGSTIANSPAYGIDHTTNPTLMLIVPCGNEDALFTWFPGAPPARHHLSDPAARPYRHVQISYDANQGLLHIRSTNSRRDCGHAADWAWVDGDGFMQLTSWWMPDCRGLPPGLWPQTYMLGSWAIR